MAIFTNKFFSKAGQKERLSNIGATLKASLTGKGVQANTKNANLNKLLSKAASNPLTTAGIIAGAKNPKALTGALRSGFSSLSGTAKAVTIAGGVAGTSLLLTSSKARSSLSNPEQSLKQFGSNTGALIDKPSLENAKVLFKGNPILTSGVIIGAGYVAGRGVTSAVTSLINTQAVKENTEILQSGLIPSGSTTAGDIISSKDTTSSLSPNSQLTPFETAKTSNYNASPSRKRKKYSKIKAKPENINIRVYNNNQDGQYIRNKR